MYLYSFDRKQVKHLSVWVSFRVNTVFRFYVENCNYIWHGYVNNAVFKFRLNMPAEL